MKFQSKLKGLNYEDCSESSQTIEYIAALDEKFGERLGIHQKF